MTLPQEIRDRIEVSEGDRIGFVRQGGKTVVVPLRHTLLHMRGSVKVSEKAGIQYGSEGSQISPDAR